MWRECQYMKNKNYYLGLDIGTDSVGYAVTDEKYNLLKFHGDPAWGTMIFDAGSLNTERRSFRTSRRRLDRRQQRVLLLQELFAPEIAKVDERFFIRIMESYKWRSDTTDKYVLFNDAEYTDKEYFEEYPTIHHLICELMNNIKSHDIRLVYLACSWLVAHRGHFLSNIGINDLSVIKDFKVVYEKFESFFIDNSYAVPWENINIEMFGKTLKERIGVTQKYKKLVQILLNGEKPSKEGKEDFPFSLEAIIRLLAGGTCKLKDVFHKEEYEEYGSVSLDMDDDKLGEIMANIGEDYNLLSALRTLNDWAILAYVLNSANTISEAKVNIYYQHKKDMATLKYFVKKYCMEKYDEIFRVENEKVDNYVAYTYHTNDGDTSNLKQKAKIEEFSKYILKILKDIEPEESDIDAYQDMITRLELRQFLPKQKCTDNRVIPQQLYQYELNKIIENASEYLPFLKYKDNTGLTTGEKISSIFTFRVPYFVGPLNQCSSHAWIERKAEKIYPWNFNDVVDLDVSEQNFIQRMTNYCTYIPGEPVLPKDSLCYHKFMVLNEINNIRINGTKISVELKQKIYNDLFMHVKKVTRKKLLDYLISNGHIDKGDEDCLSGIDIEIKSNLAPQIAFRKLLESGIINECDAEKIIERATYSDDKTRLSKWLSKNYPQIAQDDRKYICKLKIKDFGRLSGYFLTELEGMDNKTGETTTILKAMWETNNNLMELLSEEYTFEKNIEDIRVNYYTEHKVTLQKRLDDMYISNAVRRPIYRTLDIVNDIYKAFGTPGKIFIEMTRGADENQKGKRTKSRKQQIMELYDKCKDEDVRILRQQLEEMGEYADNRLQGDKLFLYYMQFGKSAYSGQPILLEKLGTKEYDIDHIYPQAYVKDDSIINNKVLVLSTENGTKSDKYPIEHEIRQKMRGYWNHWKEIGAISEEKYKRLTRTTPFTADEKYGFINRQLTETSQSTKAVATLLKERFPETEIVYSKARLVSEFRNEFDLYKSRTFNDLHHAVDAYLNIVTGNVYSMKFSKQWFNVDSKYSIKTKTLFTNPLVCNGITVWDGKGMLQKVKYIASKNNAHFTKYAFFKKGGLFDQMPVKKAEGLTPKKKDMPTEKYGGYNKAGIMFYIPVCYKAGKKSEIIIMSVELLSGDKFLIDESFAKEYSFNRLKHILGKEVNEISFPMGMRPWKVNTMLSLDGFRICITGIGGGGKCLVAQPIVQFSANEFWKFYLKKLEMFVEKQGKNPNYIYDETYDKVSQQKNLELYDLYVKKLKHTIYQKRMNSPLDLLEKGRIKFEKLSIEEQSKTLLNIQQVFGRMTGGCDLEVIGGKKKSASTVNFSSTISNWKKYYSDVRIIDSSASGLWEKQSQNLLELL